MLEVPDPGSPKVHSQALTVPAGEVDPSWNWVGLLIHAVSNVKSGTGAALADIDFPNVSQQPVAFVTLSLTQKAVPVENACAGLCKVEVLLAPEPGSPKSHNHDTIGVPLFVWDRSVNWFGMSAQAPAALL